MLLESIERVYSGLRKLLKAYCGTLSNYVGDAFFATWETSSMPDAATAAVSFALDAAARVREIAPSLPLRDPHGGSRCVWGLVLGSAGVAVSMMAGAIVTVLGDATNVTFRLSGIASRSGWPDVVVTDTVHDLMAGQLSFAGPVDVEVKGRGGQSEGLRGGAGRPAGQCRRGHRRGRSPLTSPPLEGGDPTQVARLPHLGAVGSVEHRYITAAEAASDASPMYVPFLTVAKWPRNLRDDARALDPRPASRLRSPCADKTGGRGYR